MEKRLAKDEARELTASMLARTGIVLSPEERQAIEIADMGLDDLEQFGLEVVTYVNNDRYCAKELVLFGRQTCPEHRHPPVGNDPGKTETFRCRWGRVFLYVEGEPSATIQARIPEGTQAYFTVFKEVQLNPGDQFTIPPNTLHWFQADGGGAVVSEFSSTSRDETDIWTDPRIRRVPT